jgi:hypothetical protein
LASSALARQLPSLDLGLAACALHIGTEGAVQRRIFPHGAADGWFLFHISGAPARPVPAHWVTWKMENGAYQRFYTNEPAMRNQHAQRDETTTPHAFHYPFSILHF